MAKAKATPAARAAILETLARVGREHSDATVLFHSRLAEFLGLATTDYKTLSVIDGLGPVCAGDLARLTGLATASVTSLIDRLERKGFVTRVDDPADRRRVLVEVRRDRLASWRQKVPSPAESLARLWDRYSDAELKVIADFLGGNADRLRAETEALNARPTPARRARRQSR